MKSYVCVLFFSIMTQFTIGQQVPLLKISQDSSYIVTENNEAFFWLGGTAWELIHRLEREEIDMYLSDRAKKGFTVIQTVILAELDGLNTPNAYGEKPLLDNDPTRLNEKYFEHVDYLIDKADALGLYVALLPTWGDKFNKKWGAGPEIFTAENATIYGRLLAKRYVNRDNLIWVLGGDRGLETKAHQAIIRSMAQGIRQVDTRHLMTFHPVGGKKATDFIQDPWLDIDMFQSGHSSQVKEYSNVAASKKSNITRPVINGEARYENIQDRFWENNNSYSWLNDWDVRVSAYWSILAGAAGYTYGCNDIWQMYDVNQVPILNARTDWQVALQLPGSTQMGYMKDVFEAFDWQKMQMNQSIIVNENKEDESYMIAAMAEDRQFALVYIPTGNPVKIDASLMSSSQIKAFWFNPRSGKLKHIGQFTTDKTLEFKPWSSGKGSDFLLILTTLDYPLDWNEWNK